MPFVRLEDGRKMRVRVVEAGKAMAKVEYWDERQGIDYMPDSRKHWMRVTRWVRRGEVEGI